MSVPREAIACGAPPQAASLTLAIGELENRTKPVPVTFSSENLYIRHRLPDHRSRIGAVPVGTQPLGKGFPRPRTPRSVPLTSLSGLPEIAKRTGAPRSEPASVPLAGYPERSNAELVEGMRPRGRNGLPKGGPARTRTVRTSIGLPENGSGPDVCGCYPAA